MTYNGSIPETTLSDSFSLLGYYAIVYQQVDKFKQYLTLLSDFLRYNTTLW